MAQLDVGPVLTVLADLAREDGFSVAVRAVRALGRARTPAGTAALTELLQFSDARIRRAAVEALGQVGTEATVSALTAALMDAADTVRWTAADALGALGSRAPLASLKQSADSDDSPRVRWAARRAIAEITAQESRDA